MSSNGTLFSTFNYLVPAAGQTSAYVANLVAAVKEPIDFARVSNDAGIPFNPSGVQVDNFHGVGDCVITVVETGFTMTVPAGFQQGYQFPAPEGATVLVSGDGATIAFVDYPVIPYQFYHP